MIINIAELANELTLPSGKRPVCCSNEIVEGKQSMVKPELNGAARGTGAILRQATFALCFLAVAVVTGHIFQHVIEGASNTLLTCRVCSSLSTCAASAPAEVPEPTGKLTVSAEHVTAHPIISQTRLNPSRAPPHSA